MATIDILFEGYLRGSDERHIGSTVSLVRDVDAVVVIDPGLVPNHAAILDPLTACGVQAEQVTDVVFSHHHPDHTLNAALFPNARFHDHWAIYQGDVWDSRPAEGFAVSPDITFIETPGHSAQDVTTLVRTDEGLTAFTHLWWSADGPDDDPYAPDLALLHANRARVLALHPRVIVPGHGAPFEPSGSTPR